MQVLNWHEFLNNGLHAEKNLTSMTVGVFDGMHRGHQSLIERIVSHNADYTPAVVTFRENHKTGSGELCDIFSFEQRLAMFEKFGVQIVIAVDFTDEFRKMPGGEFLEILLKHGNVGFFAVGSDFRCGYQLDTDAAAIEKFFTSRGIPAEIAEQEREGAMPISSSRIRAAIASGDHALAQIMLGQRGFLLNK